MYNHLKCSPLRILSPDQFISESKIILKLPEQVNTQPRAAFLDLCVVIIVCMVISCSSILTSIVFSHTGSDSDIEIPWDRAGHSSVHGASASDRVGVRDDDEGRLLQESDLDAELFWDSLWWNMTVIRPHYVLDVQT